MNKLGDASFSQETIDAVLKYFELGSTILELGSGYGSQVLANQGYKYYCIEHDKRWIGKYNGINYIHAPLKNRFYDLSEIKIPKYDLLIIDGPPAHVGTRSRIKEFHDVFDLTRPVFIDDAHRIDEKLLATWIKSYKTHQKTEPTEIEIVSNLKKSILLL